MGKLCNPQIFQIITETYFLTGSLFTHFKQFGKKIIRVPRSSPNGG